TLVANVINVAPTIDAGANITSNEGDSVSLSPNSFNDKGTRDTHSATINWGDGTPLQTGLVTESPFGTPGSTAGANGTVAGSHVYADSGAYTVTACVTDDDGAPACDTLVANVSNVTPTANAGTDQIVTVRQPFTLTGTWSDPGLSSDNPYHWTWTVTTPAVDSSGQAVAGASGNAAYGTSAPFTTDIAVPGAYTFTFTIVDKDGASNSDQVVVTIPNNHWVVFGANSVEFKEGSQVLSGDVGGPFQAAGKTLTEKGVEVGVGVNAQIGPGSAVYADSLRVKSKSSVFLAFFRELIDRGPGNVVNEVNVLPPGIVAPSLPTPTGSVGTQDVWFNPNKSDCKDAANLCLDSGATLTPGAYGDLRSRAASKKDTAVLYLAAGDYYFDSIDLGAFAQVRANGPVHIYVAIQMDTDHDSFIGPADGSGINAKNIVFWIGGISGKKGTIGSHPKSVQIGVSNSVQANIYAPNGTIWLAEKTTATGAFVARDVEVGAKVTVSLDSAF
ncbi:MAG: PKD domain-containing protein, partial [Chloroflexota bacterium]|nr:PKD domain-containing protein [Chloroflexota bacterium]